MRHFFIFGLGLGLGFELVRVQVAYLCSTMNPSIMSILVKYLFHFTERVSNKNLTLVPGRDGNIRLKGNYLR